MKQEETNYGLQLTYGNLLSVDPAGYKNTNNQEFIKKYKEITRQHLNALFASIRRHGETAKGRSWKAKIYAVASCSDGIVSDDLMLRQLVRTKRKRLHIHVFVNGIPGSTICAFIRDYWKPRYGIVQYEKYNEIEWVMPYFASQAIVKRQLILG
ncbi:hypothetical protein [Anaeroarcus burkinensis]|uniref:hypothetical protein n=1 Tax=Anaeroarcus burkinensis TaxID=82376 RepID=UPI00048A39BC|nr:hypothetical protein [Anaeroarcus burkinensis]